MFFLSAYCFDFMFITYHCGLFSKGTPNANYSILVKIVVNSPRYQVTPTQLFILIIHVISWIFFSLFFRDSISLVSQTALIILYTPNQYDCVKSTIVS